MISGVGLAWVEFCLFLPWGAFATLLGNALIQHASWRWIYYISLIYSVISLVGLAIFYFPPSRGLKGQTLSRRQAFLQLDFIGIMLFSAGITLFLIGLAWGGTDGHPWTGSSVIAPIVIGFTCLVACFSYDWTLVKDDRAFFPWHLFSRFKEYSVLLIVSFVSGVIYYPNLGLLPQATFWIFTNDPIRIGILLLPNNLGQFFGSTVIPGLLHLTRKPKFFIVAAIFLQTLFTGLYAYAIPDHLAAWVAFQFFGQGCFDWITTCALVNLSLHVKQSDLGLAVGLTGTFRSLGGSVGNAVFGAVLGSQLHSQLVPRISQAAISAGFDATNLSILVPAVLANAAGAPDAFTGVQGYTSAIGAATALAVKQAYAFAYQRVFYTAIPFGVVAVIAALFIADGGKYMTSHTSVTLEKEVLGSKKKV